MTRAAEPKPRYFVANRYGVDRQWTGGRPEGYATRGAAVQAAKRKAKATPGARYYILCPHSTFICATTPVKETVL